jgi:hypothetical protein
MSTKPLRNAAFGLLAGVLYAWFAGAALAQRNEYAIHDFVYGTGNDPFSNPVFDQSTGILYGVTTNGGTNGTGVIYKAAPPDSDHKLWRYSAIYDVPRNAFFSSVQPLVAASGVVYGILYPSGCGSTGCGEVLALSPRPGSGAWSATVLHQFTGGNDGSYPTGPLVADGQGAFYGVSRGGGTGCESGCGFVYKLTPPIGDGRSWDFSVVYNFTGGNDVAFPNGLTMDKQGRLYGWGSFNQQGNKEDVFELTPPSGGGGWTEKILYHFYFSADSCGISGPLSVDADAKLYGVLSGSLSSCGQYAFQLAPSSSDPGVWTKTTMRQFTSSNGGIDPTAPLTLDASGTVYGTIGNTVYMLKPRPGIQGKWNYKPLFMFMLDGRGDGELPWGGVVLDSAGAIYGTTQSGGATGRGVLYRLSP